MRKNPHGKILKWEPKKQHLSTIARGVHTTSWPAQPVEPAQNLPATTQTDQSDNRRQVATHKTRSLQVSWQVSYPKTRATGSDHKINKIRWDPKVFEQRASWNPLQSPKSSDTFYFRRRATWNPPNPARSRRDLVQIQRIWPNIDQILTDLAKYQHRLQNPKSTNNLLEIDRPKLDDPTIKMGRFRFWFSPTRKLRVESRSGTNLTYGHP